MNGWETAATILAILAPLVGVPLTVMIFYLKGTREQQAARYADLSQRVKCLEASLREKVADVSAIRRDYTTKEEWLRESMWAKDRIEKLNASVTRVVTELDGMTTVLATAERTSRIVSLISERLEAVGGIEENCSNQ